MKGFKVNGWLLGLLWLAALAACTTTQNGSQLPVESTDPLAGIWRGTINMQGQELPFNFEVALMDSAAYEFTLINGAERIPLDNISPTADSIILPMHIFDTEMRLQLGQDLLRGIWQKNYYTDYVLPVKAVKGISHRFAPPASNAPGNVHGRWAVTFDYEGEKTQAIGEFRQDGSRVEGTFLTPLGDYRFLQGNMNGNNLSLSAFDGEHAFLFLATLQENGSLKGQFWSGKSWYETWTAVRNDTAQLPDPESLTYLKEGYDRFDFSFPDLDSNMVSLSDPAYQGQVVIVQLFGTWCPNCMDETAFLSEWYRRNKGRGVKIVALSYERKPEFAYAKERIERLTARFNPEYKFLVAGTSDKEAASKTLPMLNEVLAFPTTLFIDRQGKVRKIYTGFSGPGTGQAYVKYREAFNNTIDALLTE